MGFLDKLKGLKNAVTGGAADVFAEVGEARPGGVVPVRVRAAAKADIKAKSVYVLVSATEEATVPNVEVARNGGVHREAVHGEHQTFDVRVDLAGPQTLQNGQEYSWEGSFQLPPNVSPSFYGQTIKHAWYVQAGLDTFGNDPDSGWIEFRVG